MTCSSVSRLGLVCGLALCAHAFKSPPAQYDSVDPLIGTSGDGNTFPGATLPFGMIQWSPDTNPTGSYLYGDNKIYGFSLTHLSGAGCAIYGDVPILPWSDDLVTSPATNRGHYVQPFDHTREESRPGYYGVTLANGIKAEFSVAERAGIARFQFPEGRRARLLLNTGGSVGSALGNRIELIGNDALVGTVSSGGFCGSSAKYTIHVAAKFEHPFEHFATWQDDAIRRNVGYAEGKHTGAWLDFGSRRQVQMKIGLSFVSTANALDNLNREIPRWNLEEVRSHGRRTWKELLDRVSVVGGTHDQGTIFYTGLYHSLLAPTVFSDENMDYVGFDGKVHSLSGTGQRAQYTNFSDWDTYRNTVQLQSLLAPQRESDMMQSLVNDAAQSGWLPRWPTANEASYVMEGDSPAILLASAYAFGARGFDAGTALQYMIKAATTPGRGLHNREERPFLADYVRLGYVPANADAISASRTLEYCSADFAVAQLAKQRGDAANYRRFLHRSQNWKNLFDPESRWIRPRNADGTWLAGFDADRSLPKRSSDPGVTDQNGFDEGNSVQYTFMIPFDYPELFASIGGDSEVASRLDKFFSKLICWGEPCFNMANEPDFVTPYAYVFAGMPWKTQEVVTRIAQQTFKAAPDGIPGNDDLGATSGVYVWNALGLYPAVPGVGGMVLGTPMFESAAIRFGDGRTLVLRGKGVGPYVQEVTLNGSQYTSSWLPLSALHAGISRLDFTLAKEPNTQRGKAPADRPPSFMHPQAQ